MRYRDLILMNQQEQKDVIYHGRPIKMSVWVDGKLGNQETNDPGVIRLDLTGRTLSQIELLYDENSTFSDFLTDCEAHDIQFKSSFERSKFYTFMTKTRKYAAECSEFMAAIEQECVLEEN